MLSTVPSPEVLTSSPTRGVHVLPPEPARRSRSLDLKLMSEASELRCAKPPFYRVQSVKHRF